MKFAVLCLLAWPALAADTWTYWIQPCAGDIAGDSGCHAGDVELAQWSLDAWAKASAGSLSLRPVKEERAARLRVYWANGREKLYGETRGVMIDGERGAEVFVLPTIAATEKDPLLREAIVYLTCLHENGHAFGLPHTRNFEDIMYSFQYGGDVPAYFDRYRATIRTRDDIRRSAGLSPDDRAAIAKR